MADEFWEIIAQAERRLLLEFADDGVVRIEWVIGFVEPRQISPWLATTSDEQRMALGVPNERGDHYLANPAVTHRVAEVLKDAGINGANGAFAVAVVQSQETVDRDYEGSWFYATR